MLERSAFEARKPVSRTSSSWRKGRSAVCVLEATAKRLGLPVIVVARAGLGTINHTLLTVEAVLRDSQSVAAVVMSCRPDDDSAFAEQNAKAIERQIRGPVIRLWTDARVLDSLIEAEPS